MPALEQITKNQSTCFDASPKSTSEIDIDQVKGRFVDLNGTKSGEKPQQRLLAAMVTRDNVDWFFKMIGPAETVAKQKEAFDRFLKSVRFEPEK